MKKFVLAILCLFILLISCTAFAAEAAFYTITYHNNYEDYADTHVQTKEPGKTVKIETGKWWNTGYNFIGWSTDPDATEADYIPGDIYSKDEDMDLYAVWADPYDIGRMLTAEAFTIPAFPVANERIYIEFTVAKSGVYRFNTTGKTFRNATCFPTPEILTRNNNGYWDYIADGEYIESNYAIVDFTITAKLETNKIYLLAFSCGPDPINLKCQPQYDINPYKADIALPIGLEVVRSMAFAECAFESIHLNEAVEVIEGNAFYNCSNLKKVIFSTKDAVIDENAFSGCGAFTVVAPEGSTAQAYAQAHGLTFEVIQE